MSASQPAVSVVIPTYNRCELLQIAMSSVLNQTFADLELIVVDDGSTDDTLTYLAAISDPRVRTIVRPHTGNIATVRNAGAAHARGALLGFLDSDDIWLPDKLAVQLEQMAAAGVRWSYTRFDHMDADGRGVPAKAGQWRSVSGNIATEMVSCEVSVTVCSVIVERELFNQVGGFNEKLMRRNDYEFTARLSLSAETLAIDQLLVRVLEHPGRTTSGMSGPEPYLATALAYDQLLLVLTDKNLRRIARRRRAYHLAEAGSQYLRSNSVSAATRCFARSILDGAQPRHCASAVYRGFKEHARSPFRTAMHLKA